MKKRQIFMLGAALCTVAYAFPALATVVLPWEGPLTKLSQNLTDVTSSSIALIGLFVAGGALIFGGDLASFAKRVTWMVLAISLMLGGNAFINILSDGKALPAATATI